MSDRASPPSAKTLVDPAFARDDLYILSPGTLLDGRWRIARLLGSGAVGSVFIAHDERDGRAVAVKLLRPSLMGEVEYLERFRREAAITQRIRHPNVVDVLELGRSKEGIWYLVMELLEGEDLRARLERCRPEDRAALAVEVLTALLGALWVAHEAGVVHRDLKPANIFLWQSEGERGIKVLDFGMARDTEETTGGLTRAGEVVGTPLYMAPEQARGEKVDARADLYAAGCIGYELFCGEPPLQGPSPYLTMLAHVEETPRTPSDRVPGLPASVDRFLMRALDKDASRRCQSAAAMWDELAQVAQDLALAPAQFVDMSRSVEVSVRPSSPDEASPARRSAATLVRGSGVQRDTLPAPSQPVMTPSPPRADREPVAEPPVPAAPMPAAPEPAVAEPARAPVAAAALPSAADVTGRVSVRARPKWPWVVSILVAALVTVGIWLARGR